MAFPLTPMEIIEEKRRAAEATRDTWYPIGMCICRKPTLGHSLCSPRCRARYYETAMRVKRANEFRMAASKFDEREYLCGAWGYGAKHVMEVHAADIFDWDADDFGEKLESLVEADDILEQIQELVTIPTGWQAVDVEYRAHKDANWLFGIHITGGPCNICENYEGDDEEC